jgi:hypothetical protein
MVAGMVDPRADHPPTVHHHLPLKAAILLHRQAIDLIHLQEKVPRAALVAPASGDLEVVAQEAQDSADQVAPEALVVLASVDQVVLASVVVLVAQVVREVVAPEVLASVVAREARASVDPAWALVDLEVRVCVAAHRRNGWPNEPSVLIVTATAN